MPRIFRYVACALLLLVTACGGGSGPKKDGGKDGSCSSDAGARRSNGEACGCGGECQSGFCAGGVCCNTACTDACMTCSAQSAPGVCTFIPVGMPAPAGMCTASNVSTCGFDGTCDGQGHCRKFPAGTVCKAGACDGAAVTNTNVCDGEGRCRPGPTNVCAPFNCDPATNACRTSCRSNSDCANNGLCINNQCGLKPNGMPCTKASECGSGFCADGFCCNVGCTGACVSCNQDNRQGTCWPTDAGNPDPHGQCMSELASTCGTTGACDGIGGCALYAPETVCVPASCAAGDRINTAGTCNGLGTCRTPGVQNCAPYKCANNGCISKCTSDDDCVAGHSCVNGSCGPRAIGQPCTVSADCASNFCVDGVCCAEACTGSCRSCSLPSSLGRCTLMPAGSADPRVTCADQGASSCGTDGRCDGAGSCRKYRMGTVCAPAHCENNVFTPESTCNATGACVAPNTITCVPFACNGNQCFNACAVDANCSPGNLCLSNSCGKKPNGAFCSNGDECTSTFCAQGVCCSSTCTSSCRSCALSGSMGACTNVPTGVPDPSQTCVDRGTNSCNTNGKCEGGTCQRYAVGTPCADATCPAGTTTLTRQSSCDGAGACVTPPATSCFPYRCGASVCNSICTADADCAPPAVCTAGSCGFKPNGASCNGYGVECASGICAQGICCATACTASCVSCALAGTEGTCTMVPAGGSDPKAQCMDQGAASCGTTGFCDGKGGCQRYAAGIQCAAPTCPVGMNTATLVRTCDGSGGCRPAMMLSCGSYTCNGATCNSACGSDADCSPGNVCNAGSCGKKRLGQICASGPECDSNNCVDGVCCTSAACGTCQSCNVPGLAGLCNPVGDGEMEPHNGCTANPPCGFNGTCNGSGACRYAPNTNSCGTTSCTGSSFTPVGHCDGAGACVQPPITCGAYACGGGVCRTTCAGNSDCASGFNCQSGSCTNLLPQGAACTMGPQCTSTLCVDGVCCATACTDQCHSCNVATGPGPGTCQLVPAGGDDPRDLCATQPVSTCGTNGLCDGLGGCTKYPVGTACGPSVCVGANSWRIPKCDATNTCAMGGTTNCSPFACNSATGACRTTCSAPSDCANPATCVGGVCQ
ncbi:MAG TPA: hypothetical protein VIQ54_06555 [Polyangia bacterium]